MRRQEEDDAGPHIYRRYCYVALLMATTSRIRNIASDNEARHYQST
jgi:hypothetical protein